MVLKKWIQKGIDWLSNLILAAAGLVVLAATRRKEGSK